MLVLEAREHAEARGAKILGVLRGYGTSCDAYHMSAPLETGEGVCLAIESALKDAGVAKEEIGVVNAHATSTPLGDVAEVKALRKVFGAHLDKMKVEATKSMTGHLLGGASAIEAIALLMSLNSGKGASHAQRDEPGSGLRDGLLAEQGVGNLGADSGSAIRSVSAGIIPAW